MRHYRHGLLLGSGTVDLNQRRHVIINERFPLVRAKTEDSWGCQPSTKADIAQGLKSVSRGITMRQIRIDLLCVSPRPQQQSVTACAVLQDRSCREVQRSRGPPCAASVLGSSYCRVAATPRRVYPNRP